MAELPPHPVRELYKSGRRVAQSSLSSQDGRAPGPYRTLKAGASPGLLERPEMRDTLLFSIKNDAPSAKIKRQANTHLRTHEI